MDEHRTIKAAQPTRVVAKGDAPHHPSLPVIELDLARFHSGRWALQLDHAFARGEQPVILVARGVACLAVAWWAQLSPRSYMKRIAGAVLVSPLSLDFDQQGIAAQARLGPAMRLPFPSIVVNAGYPFVEPVLALADSWGSCFIETAASGGAGPSNRGGGAAAAEAALIARFGALDGRQPPVAIAGVASGRIARGPTRVS